MIPPKIAAMLLIMGAGLVGSYLIIKNSVSFLSASQIKNNSSQELSDQELLNQNPIKWLENKANSFTESIKDMTNLGKPATKGTDSANANDENSVNLTEMVAKTMFNKMKSLDQSGQNPFQGQGFDPNDEQSQKLIQDAVASMQGQGNLFNPKIEDKDLKISSDNSKEAKFNYLISMQEKIRKYFNDSSLQPSEDQLMKNINQDCFGGGGSANSKIAEAYNSAANENLNISVPSSWTDIHKETIFFLKKGNLIFGAIAGCSIDPMKGYLAVQALPQLASEIIATQDALKKKSAEDGLLQ